MYSCGGVKTETTELFSMNTQRPRIAVCAFFACLLAGCALFPLEQSDCVGVDWRKRGYADGFSGAPAQDMRLMEECRRRYAVDVPQAEYLAGWRDGYDEWYRIMGSMRKVGG
jgi:hypothetical protein